MLRRSSFVLCAFLALSTAACASSESAGSPPADEDRDAASDAIDGSNETETEAGSDASDHEDATDGGEGDGADAADSSGEVDAGADATDDADQDVADSGDTGCTELTVSHFGLSRGFRLAKGYDATFSPNVGSAALPDFLTLQFFKDDSPGTYDLGAGDEANFSTCKRCLIVQEDVDHDTATRTYFQSSGSLVVDPGSDIPSGTIHAKLEDVTLVEVTFDSVESTPVPNGACLHVTSAPVEVQWSCPVANVGDKACDCGCGSRDPDCADGTVASCERCDGAGSCSTNGCDDIDPNDNAVCVP